MVRTLVNLHAVDPGIVVDEVLAAPSHATAAGERADPPGRLRSTARSVDESPPGPGVRTASAVSTAPFEGSTRLRWSRRRPDAKPTAGITPRSTLPATSMRWGSPSRPDATSPGNDGGGYLAGRHRQHAAPPLRSCGPARAPIGRQMVSHPGEKGAPGPVYEVIGVVADVTAQQSLDRDVCARSIIRCSSRSTHGYHGGGAEPRPGLDRSDRRIRSSGSAGRALLGTT